MEELAGPSSVPSFFECDCVLERLWGQPFGGLTYDKKSDIIKQGMPTPPLQISPSVLKRNITFAASSNPATQLSHGCAAVNIRRNCIVGSVFYFLMTCRGLKMARMI
jgi:hypothetical protein